MSHLMLSKKYCLMVYETPALAFLANENVLRNIGDARGTSGALPVEYSGRAACAPGFAHSCAEYWSTMLDGPVWNSVPGDVFLVLDPFFRDARGLILLKVLHGERVGWIFDFEPAEKEFLGLEVLVVE